MAINSIITKMNADGKSATMELPDGKWCHTPEYLKYRYGGAGRAKPKPVQQEQEFSSPILDKLMGKLTKAERSLLLAQLVEE